MRIGRWGFGILVFAGAASAPAQEAAPPVAAVETKAVPAAPGCRLDPGLDPVRQACAKEGSGLQCAYLDSAAALLRQAPQTSAAILAEGLAFLGGENLPLLVPRLQLLSFALAAPSGAGDCLAGAGPLLLELTAAALENSQETPAGLLFLSPLLFPLAPADLRQLEAKTSPAIAQEVRRAREAFGGLLALTAAGQRIRSGIPLATALDLLQRKALSPAP